MLDKIRIFGNVNPAIAAMVINSHRSWWQARYRNGKILNEWSTLNEKGPPLPLGNVGFYFGMSSRWEQVSKQGMVGLRLLCPNGMVGELESREDGKFFQFKHGGVDIVFGGGVGRRYTDAHIIGVLTGHDDECVCRAWEVYDWNLPPEYVSALALRAQLVNEQDIARNNAEITRLQTHGCGRPAWRLIEFADHIGAMKYKNIGRLQIDVQQLKV